MKKGSDQIRSFTPHHLLVLGLLLLAPLAPAWAQTPPNVVLIIMDDVGIEHLSFYGIGSEFADTGALNAWQSHWLRFNDAWSSPECSPTRTTIHTGRYGHDTGVGRVINCDESRQMDMEDEKLLPQLIPSAYAKGAFGKWHMGTDDGAFDSDCSGLDAPLVAGYDHFEGIILDQQDQQELLEPGIYFDYVKTSVSTGVACSEPNSSVQDGYQTKDVADWAIGWIEAQLASETPYFAWVAFTAAHEPLHCPPQALYNVDFVCDEFTTDKTILYRDMIAALAEDIDRVVSAAAGIGPGDTPENPENTLVIVIGDNGSFSGVAADPVDGAKAKGTVFQGGVRVPLLMPGDLITVGGESTPEGEIVGAIDLYRTILETVGAAAIPQTYPSVNLDPYFDNVDAGVRAYLYTEWFYPNFTPGSGEGPSMGAQAIRDTRYKYIRTFDGAQEGFFDLKVGEDEWEEDNLLPLGATDPLQSTLTDLKDEMDTILSGHLEGICTKEPTAGFCDEDSDCCSRKCDLVENERINPIEPEICD